MFVCFFGGGLVGFFLVGFGVFSRCFGSVLMVCSSLFEKCEVPFDVCVFSFSMGF